MNGTCRIDDDPLADFERRAIRVDDVARVVYVAGEGPAVIGRVRVPRARDVQTDGIVAPGLLECPPGAQVAAIALREVRDPRQGADADRCLGIDGHGQLSSLPPPCSLGSEPIECNRLCLVGAIVRRPASERRA